MLKRNLSVAVIALALIAVTAGQGAAQVAISATASGSTDPATAPPDQDVQNGDFLIHANLQAESPHVTGDGLDETTAWTKRRPGPSTSRATRIFRRSRWTSA
jgi:hypothetical protein